MMHYDQYGNTPAYLMPIQHAAPSMSFCMECGAQLQPGCTFCMQCGMQAGAASDNSLSLAPAMPLNPYAGASPYPGNYPGAYPYAVQNQQGGSGGVLMMGMLLIVAAIIFLAAVLLVTQNGEGAGGVDGDLPFTFGDSETQSEEQTDTEGSSDEPIELNETYTTDDEQERFFAYPTFKFKYGDNWVVNKEESDFYYELVSMRDNYANEISFVLIDDSVNESYSVRIKDIEKVADCSLKFNGESVAPSSNKFAVAKFSVERSNSSMLPSGSKVVAVLPEDAINKPALIDFSTGLPSFDCGCNISFLMIYDDEYVSEQEVSDAIAILSSLEFVKEVPAVEVEGYNDDAYDYHTSAYDYVISYSSDVALTEDDISYLSDYELYLARNEIYARHGRIFVNDDLNQYFNSKSWYYPSIAPESFSDSMLSQVERDNLQTILSLEKLRGSPYI